MNLLLDTNIILNIVRAKNFDAIRDFVNPGNSLFYISIVSEAEIKSLAIKNKWGTNRKNVFDKFLKLVSIIDINNYQLTFMQK